MSKGPGHIIVTTEVGFCNFCGRPRNLRREERHLGELVRTTVTCESCHRTLFSTMGVATAATEHDASAPPAAETPAAGDEPAGETAPVAVSKPKAAAAPAAKPSAAVAEAKPAAARAKPAPKRLAKGR